MKPLSSRLIAGAGGAAVAAGFVAAVRALEFQMIFWPSRRLGQSPADRGLEFEEVTLEPAPGTPIHGWFIPHPQARAAVLYLEGNGGNRSSRLGHVELLHRMGCSVLIMDYEGYADSAGRATETNVYRDARAARAWMASRFPDLPLVLFGESLGGAVATQLSRDDPPDALIIDHSFTTMGEMIDRVCRGIPLRHLCRSRFHSIENLKHYHGPLLVVHGEDDRFIPIEHGRRLFEAANQPKAFLAIPGAGHNQNELLEIGGDLYRGGIAGFLDGALPAKP